MGNCNDNTDVCTSNIDLLSPICGVCNIDYYLDNVGSCTQCAYKGQKSTNIMINLAITVTFVATALNAIFMYLSTMRTGSENSPLMTLYRNVGTTGKLVLGFMQVSTTGILYLTGQTVSLEFLQSVGSTIDPFSRLSSILRCADVNHHMLLELMFCGAILLYLVIVLVFSVVISCLFLVII